MRALSFEPTWTVPPGTTIRDILCVRQINTGDLSAEIDLSVDEVDQLIAGQIPIDEELAERLGAALGPSKAFWLRREVAYRKLAAGLATLELDRQTFLAALPLRDMRAFGWLDGIAAASSREAAEKFFEDETGDWRRNGRELISAVAFRTSNAHASNAASVAAWLRQGIRRAEEIECEAWQPEKLRNAIPQIRALSRLKQPKEFVPQLIDICRSAGVAVVIARTPAGCRASGATHFTPTGKPIVQLSFRYRSDDHLWFTIFHELGHLLLHKDTPLFIEGQEYLSGDEEEEANRFSQDTLIPQQFREELGVLPPDFRKIMRFAKRLGISPGIVVGQMQKQGHLRHNQMNFLKNRYDWPNVAAANP